MSKKTPLMEQYYSIKKKYKDSILFFRMGDFYEMFDEDAKVASDVLGLTLTSRAHGKASDVPLAGFPHHSVEVYLTKMLKAGYKVAICEQVEDPRKAKGIVKREVLEVITPGTATSENVINSVTNNYLLSVCINGEKAGLAGIDISTGDFFLTEGNLSSIISQIESLQPPEILVPMDQSEKIRELLKNNSVLYTKVEDYYYSQDYAYETLIEQFKTISLKGFGCEELDFGVCAAGAAMKYVQGLQNGKLGHINKITTLNSSSFMALDNVTRRNLEIIDTMNPDNSGGSLLAVLDKTTTKMGARLLRSWIIRPLLGKIEICRRHQSVEELLERVDKRSVMEGLLSEVNDIERITAKVNSNRVNPRELKALSHSLKILPELKDHLEGFSADLLTGFYKDIKTLEELSAHIDEALTDDPPMALKDGRIIRDGFSEELDELKILMYGGKKWISDLQEAERQKTGIPSLKINYNKVFGYYIEITKSHLSKVPENYIRKQTLVNAERYITPEMKEKEDSILNAEEKCISLEMELFDRLKSTVREHTVDLQKDSQLISKLDVLLGFANAAEEYSYCKPEMTDDHEIHLVESRHPVVERLLPIGEPFIPNDYNMDIDKEQLHIITGPNMAGKSTILRQVGLCVLMAQIGSFVPAESATLGIVDRIFTRVGAQDNVSKGESTFLVEMLELANILNNATSKSLLLLDEVGRGTSTFDGLSIAWATVEYIHNTNRVSAKTLFATHYHELTAISKALHRVSNYHVQVKEYGDTIVFLHKLMKGTSDHSYGIQVAKMAGVPEEIISRAKVLLTNLEAKELTPERMNFDKNNKSSSSANDDYQVNLFTMEDTYLRQTLSKIDPDNITPREAIQTLFELKEILFGKSN